MKLPSPSALKKIDLVVFDLDGTLADTKSVMDSEMADLFARLLAARRVAVIGGGKYPLFRIQLASALALPKSLLHNLFLFPTTSTSFYRYVRGWKNVYRHELPRETRAKIKKAFRETFVEAGYVPPRKTYGPVIEDRRTQVTFSALGQNVVAVLGKKKGVALKEKWKRENAPIKLRIAKLLAKRLPGFEVRAAGHTSVDVTAKGIDKAYGLRQIEKYLHVPIRKMLFVGDALFPGGNDYAAKRTGVRCVSVENPEDTKRLIREVLRAAS